MSGAVIERPAMDAERRATLLKEYSATVNDKKANPDQRAVALCKIIDLRAAELLAGTDPRVDRVRLIEMMKLLIREKSDAVLGCTLPSIMRAAKVAVMSGLRMDKFKGEIDFIPRAKWIEVPGRAKKVKIKELCADPNYRGLIRYVEHTGQMKAPPFVECIYEGEQYAFEGEADDMRVRHTKDPLNQHRRKNDKDKILAVYVRWYLKDRTVDHLMTWEQILEHRDKYSKGYQDAEKSWGSDPPKRNSTWHTEPIKMALKTVIRDAVNRDRVPVSDVDRNFIIQAERAEREEASGADVIDAEFVTDVEGLDGDEEQEAEAQPVAQPQPQKPPQETPEQAFDRYVETLAKCTSIQETGAAYDSFFGPDSAIQWPDGWDAKGHAAREERKQEIRGNG